MSQLSTSQPRVACIWGANGISGIAMIDHLINQSCQQWNRIICISRRSCQLNFHDKRIEFLSIDILNSTVEQIVEQLKQINGHEITDVFHYTYIQKSTEEELDEINRILLEKTLDACQQIAGTNIRTFSLQTGYKVYIYRQMLIVFF